jgi:hypothetical protein
MDASTGCKPIGFRDPDGLKLEIAAVDGLESAGRSFESCSCMMGRE